MNDREPTQLPLTATEEWIAKQVRAALGPNPEPFRPFAVYDAQLDRIWVQIRDCSTLQVRVNDVFFMLEDMHPQEGEAAQMGFEIYGVRAYFKMRDRVDVFQLLQLVFRIDPDTYDRIRMAKQLLKHVESPVVQVAG